MLNNQKGSALLWVLGAASIVAVISAALPQFFSNNERDFKLNYTKSSISILKESFIAMLDNDAVWAETLNRNASMNCLKTAGLTCAAGMNSGINVYDADGTLIMNSAATSGLTLNGDVCNQFNATAGHATCVLKFNLTWECNGGVCPVTTFDTGVLIANKPAIKLKGQLSFSPADTKIKNLLDQNSSAYSFDFIRGSNSKTLSKFCNSISGVFNQQELKCDAANSEPGTFDCTTTWGPRPHDFFVGFDSSGTPICAADINLGANCNGGQAVLGYRSDGGIACGPF